MKLFVEAMLIIQKFIDTRKQTVTDILIYFDYLIKYFKTIKYIWLQVLQYKIAPK